MLRARGSGLRALQGFRRWLEDTACANVCDNYLENGRSCSPLICILFEIAARACPGASECSKSVASAGPETAECSTGAARICSGTAKCSTGALRATVEVQNARREPLEPPLAPQHARKVPLAPIAARCVRCLRSKWPLEGCWLVIVYYPHHIYVRTYVRTYIYETIAFYTLFARWGVYP